MVSLRLLWMRPVLRGQDALATAGKMPALRFINFRRLRR